MKKILFTLLLLLLVVFITNEAISQNSCYNTGVCNNWSSWVQEYETYNLEGFGNCNFYIIVKYRYCLDDPSETQVHIVQWGIVPPTGGQNCDDAMNYLEDGQGGYDYGRMMTLMMRTLRQWAIDYFGENYNGTNFNCTTSSPPGDPLRIVYYFPGECTKACVYINNETGDWYMKQAVCEDDFCCGKIFNMCWDTENEELVINETLISGPGEPCTFQPQGGTDLCPQPSNENDEIVHATDCLSSCTYGSE